MEIPVIVFEDQMSNEADRKEQVVLLEKVQFCVNYSSVYGEKFVLTYRLVSKRHAA